MNKTKLWIMLLGISLLYSLPGVGMLSAQTNNMPLLCTMYGEFNGAVLGRGLASLDFNGDGIKDLVALEGRWNPYGVLDPQYDNFGRINFYWGGADFDANLDASISGEAWEYVNGMLVALGDINNDGKEDLAFVGSEFPIEKLCIFFGRTEPNPVPDYVLSYRLYPDVHALVVRPLGDINSDGYDDVGISVKRLHTDSEFLILDGATMALVPAGTCMPASYYVYMCGIGDANADGYDDYLITRVLHPTSNTHYRITLFFGGDSIPPSDSLVITEDTNGTIDPNVGPLGDLNGDGIDDFVGWVGGDGFRIWYGSSALTPQWDLLVPSQLYTYPGVYALVPGDFNGDGFTDMISSNPNYDSDGSAFMWLGGANMNGIYDLRFFAPTSISEKFGWDKVAGDFNNDGFCDVAISQPWADPDPLRTPGRVHVYLGNAGLTDTTVANDDPLLLPPPQLSVRVFPNPLQREEIVQMEIKTLSAPQGDQAILRIFNSRGQQIYHQEHITLSGKSTTLPLQLHDLANGVYICQIQHGHTVNTTKLTIMK